MQEAGHTAAGVGRKRGVSEERLSPEQACPHHKASKCVEGTHRPKEQLHKSRLSRSLVTRTKSQEGSASACSCLCQAVTPGPGRLALGAVCCALGTTGPCWTSYTQRRKWLGHWETPLFQEALHLRFSFSPSARVLPGFTAYQHRLLGQLDGLCFMSGQGPPKPRSLPAFSL